MRERFNLDINTLDRFSLMVIGINGAGKTRLLGDMLAHEKSYGEVLYVHAENEDGLLTISGMNIGNNGVTVSTYEEYMEAIGHYADSSAGKELQAIAIDSLHAFVPLCKLVVMQKSKYQGTDRDLVIPNADERKAGAPGGEWSEFHILLEKVVRSARKVAKYTMFACAMAPTGDPMSLDSGMKRPDRIGPDLPGTAATRSAGWFNFVGELKVRQLADGPKREFDLRATGKNVIRQSIPNEITDIINIPTGKGGWLAIKNAIEGGLK